MASRSYEVRHYGIRAYTTKKGQKKEGIMCLGGDCVVTLCSGIKISRVLLHHSLWFVFSMQTNPEEYHLPGTMGEVEAHVNTNAAKKYFC